MESLHHSHVFQASRTTPANVQISAIERELTRLWSSAERADGATPLLRPRTVNLVVATADAATLARAHETAAHIVARHPGRSIAVGPDPDASRLLASVAVFCPLSPNGQTRFCSEVVTLAGPPQALHEAHSAVAGLLVPDLPTFLWWQRPVPTDEPFFRSLERLADYLIVDSRMFPRVAVGLRGLIDIAADRNDPQIADLEWLRLTPWRELIARAFRGPDTRNQLDSLNDVKVRYSVSADAMSAPPPSCWLLVGWLASRLQWRTIESSIDSSADSTHTVWRARYRHRMRDIAVEIRPVVRDDQPPGEIVGVELAATHDAEPFRIVIDREVDGDCAATSVFFGDQILRRQVGPLPTAPLDELVANALDAATTDPIYLEALRVAVH